jgi:hypothetical protein
VKSIGSKRLDAKVRRVVVGWQGEGQEGRYGDRDADSYLYLSQHSALTCTSAGGCHYGGTGQRAPGILPCPASASLVLEL